MGSLAGHNDGVMCMAKDPTRLSTIVSGAADGEVKVWDLHTRSCLHTAQLHHGFVHGVCVTPDGTKFISVGQVRNILVFIYLLDASFHHTATTIPPPPPPPAPSSPSSSFSDPVMGGRPFAVRWMHPCRRIDAMIVCADRATRQQKEKKKKK